MAEKKYLIDNAKLMAEWNWDKNNDSDPHTLTFGSNKKVCWKCKICGHEWEASINHRTNGTNCPICSRAKSDISRSKTAALKNNFMKKYPELANEWHPNKNKGLSVNEVSVSCNKKVWWLCSFCGHEWQDTVTHRSSGRHCPNCSKAQTSFAEQTIYYYVSKEFPDTINRYKTDFEFDIYIPSKKIAIEYDGYFYRKTDVAFKRDNKKDEFCENQGITLIRFRSKRLQDTKNAIRITCENNNLREGIIKLFRILNPMKIPDIDFKKDTLLIREQFKSNLTQKSITIVSPHLVSEWHPTKNGKLKPSTVPAFSNIYIWWKCETCGYEWQDTANHRSNGRGCHFCSGKVIISGKNDLATLYPNVAKEWNYEKNFPLLPTEVANKSNKKVWWKCPEYGHEWQAVISERTRGNNRATKCPYCSNKKVLIGFNDLATTHKHLLKQWNYQKNISISPKEITKGSNKKVWWICDKCGHEWESIVYSRTNGCGCPQCAKQNSKSNK